MKKIFIVQYRSTMYPVSVKETYTSGQVKMNFQGRSKICVELSFLLSNSCFFLLSNYRFIDYRTSFVEKFIDSSISIHEINLSN